MATTRIVVPFWPSSADNLSWSSDNLIAVGGGEWIAILVPRLNTKGPNSLTWDSIAHRINLFTSNEIPFSEPLSSVNWSIGEEMSLRHVWRLDWSPPGLARFNTCALAVLHTNHVLVLWECVGQPHIRDRWKRSLIVNHAIQAYYGTTITDDPEIKQVSQRIRSFAWISAVSKKHKSIDRRLDPHVSQREHYLAVSTDGGDIFILRVFSPHDVLTPENHSWKATVVFRQPLSPELPGKHTETLHTGSSTVAGAVDLAFSDWDDQASAKFAYIAGGRLYVCDARHDSSAPSGPRVVLEEPREYPIPTSFDIRGPLKFVPKSFSLMVFGSDVVMNIDTTSASIDEMRSHHLDGRWDNISGLAFTANAEALPTLNLVSHLSTASSATSVLPVSLEDDSDTRETHWHNAIHESKANFSASYDLGTNVQERTWGITTSPLGDIVATCVSMLPSDSPAHVIQSSQRSVVALTTDFQSTEAPFPYYGGRSPPENVSAEIILYGLRQFAERGGKVDGDEDTKEAMRQAVMNTLDVSLPVSVPPLPWAHDDDRDFEMNAEEFQTCLTNIKARFYWEGDMFFQRLDRLTDVVAQRPLKTQLTKDQYYHVATAVLDLPFELCEISPLSRKIGGAFSALKAKLENTESAVDPAMVDDASFVEECSMCHQDIVLESLRWSRCAGGHQFSRCTLTFLSIMKPGISKSCRICSAIYLKEDALAEFKKIDAGSVKVEGPKEAESMDVGANSPNNDQNGEQRDDDIEPNLSLARLLFAACDVCILCGGKFVA